MRARHGRTMPSPHSTQQPAWPRPFRPRLADCHRILCAPHPTTTVVHLHVQPPLQCVPPTTLPRFFLQHVQPPTIMTVSLLLSPILSTYSPPVPRTFHVYAKAPGLGVTVHTGSTIYAASCHDEWKDCTAIDWEKVPPVGLSKPPKQPLRWLAQLDPAAAADDASLPHSCLCPPTFHAATWQALQQYCCCVHPLQLLSFPLPR